MTHARKMLAAMVCVVASGVTAAASTVMVSESATGTATAAAPSPSPASATLTSSASTTSTAAAETSRNAALSARLDVIADRAGALTRLNTLIVARNGSIVLERGYRGAQLDAPVNIKSASKVIVSALVGRAIDEGLIASVGASIRPLLAKRLPGDANPRLGEISVEDLLTMRAGLERTSGPNYGRWIASRDWVGYIVSRPFVDEPGGRMLYSTGSSHLLSAILTDASRRSTLQLAQRWLGEPLGIRFAGWDRDPQGVYLGGNNMALSARALFAFGDMMRAGGVNARGERVLSEAWIKASWTPRTQSQFTGDAYGYGWFITEAAGHPVYYAWGYGGQLLYVVPTLGLIVVMTSDPNQPSGSDGYLQQLHTLFEQDIVGAVIAEPVVP
ncbi:serine hydrolase [Alcaligenaceae bacterium B3P038]|nr:serine hydrolase [Alcaligenaceae bacterium B3P038]